jgi:hypothetical protein
MPFRLFSLIILLCLSSVLHAQSDSPPHYQIYGGYSFLSNSIDGVTGSHHPLNGFDAAVAFISWHNLRFKIDASGYSGTNLGAPQHPFFILSGGQYSWNIGRESIFGEALIGTGGANKTWAANNAQGQTASFAALMGGGLDTALTPHVAFRVSGGYQYSYFALDHPATLIPYRIPGLPKNFGRISSGLVFQF